LSVNILLSVLLYVNILCNSVLNISKSFLLYNSFFIILYLLIGIAYPTLLLFFIILLIIPTTLLLYNKGPPEFPGLTGVSVCMSPSCLPLIIPRVILILFCPNGKPIAITSVPDNALSESSNSKYSLLLYSVDLRIAISK